MPSLAQADVTSCVSSASADATIHLPSGQVTWTGSITINKSGLKFIGQTTGCPSACVDNTVITTTTANAFLPQHNNWRISGITFFGGSQTYGIIWANRTGSSSSSGWRIDHNHFLDFTGRAITVGAGTSAGSTYGKDYPALIDNNRFRSAVRRKAVEVYGHSLSAHGSWDDPLDLGGTDWTFIEDNVMDYDTLVDGTADAFDTDYNGKAVVRYNTFRNGGVSAHGVEDCNDFSAFPCSGRSVRGLEVYGNSFTFSVDSSFTVNIRGGTGVVWGNTATGTHTGYAPWRYYYQRGDGGGRCIVGGVGQCQGSGAWDGNQTGLYGYVCYQQPGTTGATGIETAPYYQWMNTGFGSTSESGETTATYDSSCNYQHVQVGRDVRLVERTSVGTSLPASCLVGEGYWKTDEGEWNSKSAGADGRLYKCTALDTWTLFYTPYIYPHPLQTYVPPTTGTLTLGGSGSMTPGAGGTITLSP